MYEKEMKTGPWLYVLMVVRNPVNYYNDVSRHHVFGDDCKRHVFLNELSREMIVNGIKLIYGCDYVPEEIWLKKVRYDEGDFYGTFWDPHKRKTQRIVIEPLMDGTKPSLIRYANLSSIPESKQTEYMEVPGWQC